MANGRGPMSQAVARQILKYKFTDADQARLDDLLERNRESALSPAEKDELMEFVRFANFLAILQSHARTALKRAGKVKA
jgi:hypothetical protein